MERKGVLEKLIQRRRKLQRQYDELISEPASYGITGSVNVVNHGLDALRKELDLLDVKIQSLLSGDSSGISRSYPRYA